MDEGARERGGLPPEPIVEWLRGDLDDGAFERWAYEAQELEAALGSERYLELIETNFRDRHAVRALRERWLGRLLQGLRCLCPIFADLQLLLVGLESTHVEKRASFRDVARHGFLRLLVCGTCGQHWLSTTDRETDHWLLARVDPRAARLALDENRWPDTFDEFERTDQIPTGFSRALFPALSEWFPDDRLR